MGTVPYGTPELTHLGIAYVVINVLWTTFILTGCAALFRFRHHHSIRKRNPVLSILAILTIHVYLCINFIMYELHGAYPCQLNFWIMSIYFPLGIALFQAQNVRLLGISAAQKELSLQRIRRPSPLDRGALHFRSIKSTLKNTTLLARINTIIVTGLIFQLMLSIIVFFISRRFVSFGVVGTPLTSNRFCTRGWEWVTTILYQGFWTYCFGPWLLWKIRRIHDVYKWKLQTVLVIAFSLPGFPMWLAASHADAFDTATLSFPAAMWFAPGLMAMQTVSLVFPLLEVYKSKPYTSDGKSLDGTTEGSGSSTGLHEKRSGRAADMSAFEEALDEETSDLFEYASTRELTGENIIFLTRVRDWKKKWGQFAARQPNGGIAPADRRTLYSEARDVFDSCVNVQASPFPINVDSTTYNELNEAFGDEKSASHKADVTPFAEAWELFPSFPDPQDKRWTWKRNSAINGVENLPITEREAVGTPLAIPENFSSDVFDRAEHSVKYIVYTNTWPRYLKHTSDSGSSTLARSSVGLSSNDKSVSDSSQLRSMP